MRERGLGNNYIFALIKIVLFLIIFCFLAELTKEFWREIRVKENFSLNIFILSILSCFTFYIFLVDLNDFYKKIQGFFFRSSFFSLVFPSVLIILGLGYFFLPKIFKFSFNRDIFLFLGGLAFTIHLIFIARETKRHTFVTFINYLFIMGILYILNLILLGVYLKIGFRISVGAMVWEGMRNGVILIQHLFTQAFK